MNDGYWIVDYEVPTAYGNVRVARFKTTYRPFFVEVLKRLNEVGYKIVMVNHSPVDW